MNKKLLALAAAVIAIGFVAAKDPAPVNPVEVGHSYLISNGSAAMKGKVAADLGNGWYSVERFDGAGTMSVNVGNSFFVQELKK